MSSKVTETILIYDVLFIMKIKMMYYLVISKDYVWGIK